MVASFDEVYERHGRAVFAYLCRLLGNRAEAEELLQETFVRYLAKERELVALNGSLGAWLFRVATNLGIDALRRRRGRPLVTEPPVPGGNGQARPDGLDLEARIRDEVERLPPDLKSTFLLRAHHGLPFRQVGEALGITERAAKQRFRRTRELLARRLDHLSPEN